MDVDVIFIFIVIMIIIVCPNILIVFIFIGWKNDCQVFKKRSVKKKFEIWFVSQERLSHFWSRKKWKWKMKMEKSKNDIFSNEKKNKFRIKQKMRKKTNHYFYIQTCQWFQLYLLVLEKLFFFFFFFVAIVHDWMIEWWEFIIIIANVESPKSGQW